MKSSQEFRTTACPIFHRFHGDHREGTRAAGTTYTISFFLTNADTANVALVQPEIGGTLLGSPVSAVGDWGGGGWQQFSFNWNSGGFSGTTSLILHNYSASSFGNDFGVDNILVASAVPEPSSLTLAIVATLGIIGYSRMRRNARTRSQTR